MLLLLVTNWHLKLLSTHGIGANNLLSTQRVNTANGEHNTISIENLNVL